MADNMSTLGLVTLAQLYRGDVVRQINRKVTLLKTIKITSGSGKNVAWAPETSGALAENFADGADAANFGQDSQLSAVLNWALYRSNIHVSQLTMDAASSSYDPAGNLQYWARAVENGCAALAKKIEQECFAGAGTGTLIAGLDVAIGNDANTYAGIDRTVGANALWKPTVVDPGIATNLTQALVRDDIRKVFEASGTPPDLALTSPTLFNSFGATFDATRRQVDTVQTARGSIRLDAGYQVLEVDGTVFMKALDATAATVYYLNTDDIELQVLPSADMRLLMAESKVDVAADDGFGQVPLSIAFEMLAKTGASSKAMMSWAGQLKVTRPNSHGVRKNAA